MKLNSIIRPITVSVAASMFIKLAYPSKFSDAVVVVRNFAVCSLCLEEMTYLKYQAIAAVFCQY